jgi:predicted  nucleic acid-binding Zn-ribbon protein
VTDYLETRSCPECGAQEFYWHFRAPDGTSLIAVLPGLPDFSALGEAKAKALAEHEEDRQRDLRLLEGRDWA